MNEDIPSVDIVIPTLNCASSLNECLKRVRSQDYPGTVTVIVVDGGSSDETVAIARVWNAHVYVNRGQYATGLQGARRFGERVCKGNLIWNLDADNWICEQDALRRLVNPLRTDEDIQFTMPEPYIEESSTTFNAWLTQNEILELNRLKSLGNQTSGWYTVDDVDYGLTNAALMRRSAVEAAGGYDTDAGLLTRLRAMGLSKGAVATGAHFMHPTVGGALDYTRKWGARLSKIVERDYVRGAQSPSGLSYTLGRVVSTSTRIPIRSLQKFITTWKPVWLWGCIYLGVLAVVALTHPRLVSRILRRMP